MLRYGNLGNVAAFGWETFFASLRAVRGRRDRARLADALPWLLLAGLVMCVVNFVVGPASSCR